MRRRIALLVLPLLAIFGVMAVPATASAHHKTDKCDTQPYVAPEDDTPGEFLKLPFDKSDGKNYDLTVTQGWVVSEDEEPFVGGPGNHNALDFEFTNHHNNGFGLPVRAAADGCAYYSYQHLNGTYTDPQGVNYMVGWGAGLFVEVIHDNGLITQYIHLDKVAKGIPYLPPTPGEGEGEWAPTPILTATGDLKPQGVRVETGDLVGFNGDTGISLLSEEGEGYRDNFNVDTGKVAPRDREAYPNWESLTNDGVSAAQLHFSTYGGRNASGGRLFTIDPLGVYGQITNNDDPYNITPGKKFATGPNNTFKANDDKLKYAHA